MKRRKRRLPPVAFQILLALSRGELHGYGIMQDVLAPTQGQVRLGPGTLYGTIGKLLDAKLSEESDERPDPKLDDERRRYYRLTAAGAEAVAAEAQHLAQLVKLARQRGLLGKPAIS